MTALDIAFTRADFGMKKLSLRSSNLEDFIRHSEEFQLIAASLTLQL